LLADQGGSNDPASNWREKTAVKELHESRTKVVDYDMISIKAYAMDVLHEAWQYGTDKKKKKAGRQPHEGEAGLVLSILVPQGRVGKP